MQKNTIGSNTVTDNVVNQVTEVSRETLPHISEIRNAFSRFQMVLIDGCYSPEAYVKAYRELQVMLEVMGLAKHIDWSPSL